MFRTILFSNVDRLVDLAAIDTFLAYHHSKESPVIAVLADAYDTFDLRCEKSSARIVYCTPAFYVWLVSHVFNHESRSVCPLQGHRICVEKDKANWEELLAGMTRASISWFPWWKEGGEGVLCSCEGFPNVPWMGTRGCINYNPMLAIRQLGYPMRGAPSEETIAPFITRGFNEANVKTLQRIYKEWNKAERKDKELSGSSQGVIGSYHKWLKSRTQGITWLPKLKSLSGEEAEMLEESEDVQALKAELENTRVEKKKLKVAITRVRKECDELKDINMTIVEALERETKKAQKEEWSRNKFRGAL